MEKLSLKQHSCQADADCFVYCKSHADLIMRNVHPDSDAVLSKVHTKDGKFHFLWMDKNEVDACFCPVFVGEPVDIPVIEDVEDIQENVVFCHNGGAYYVSRNSRGNVVIRRLTALISQQVVEQIVAYNVEQNVVESICLVHAFAIGKSKQYVATFWSVCYDNGLIEYFPVFSEDIELLKNYSIGSLLKEEAAVGSSFRYQNRIYYLQEENGKLYLAEGLKVNVICRGRIMELPNSVL